MILLSNSLKFSDLQIAWEVELIWRLRHYPISNAGAAGAEVNTGAPPAKQLGDPLATAVHVASLTRPPPTPLTMTVRDPIVIGAACVGQGLPGSR